MNKRKSNYTSTPEKIHPMDVCQTPGYALEPLLPYLNVHSPFTYIWEPACGEGNIERFFEHCSVGCTGTDLTGGYDFLTLKEPPIRLDGNGYIITNPPYGMKYAFLQKAYILKYKFAFLVPVETISTQKGLKMLEEHPDTQFLMLDKRVDFKMPSFQTWEEIFEHSAHFPVMWWTWGLGLPSQITVGHLNKRLMEWEKTPSPLTGIDTVSWETPPTPTTLKDIREMQTNLRGLYDA